VVERIVEQKVKAVKIVEIWVMFSALLLIWPFCENERSTLRDE